MSWQPISSITFALVLYSMVAVAAEESNESLDALRNAARAELSGAEPMEAPRGVAFTSGAVGLQALNPEISIKQDGRRKRAP